MISVTFLKDLSLLGCLWQSTLFIVLGFLISYFLKHRPSRAYQILLFAMIAAIAVPLMSAVVKHFDIGVFTARTYELPAVRLIEEPLSANSERYNNTSFPITTTDSVNSEPLEMTTTKQPIPWRTVATYGWLIITIILLIRLVITFLYGVLLVRSSKQSGCEKIQKAVDNVISKLGYPLEMQVRSSNRIRSPIVWCWTRISILLVPNTCKNSQIEWSGVIAHEVAHRKRFDHITGLVAEITTCLIPWHPLMWLSRKYLVRFGEQACDDWVVSTGQPSEDYAESLLKFGPQRQMAFLPAVVHSKKGLAGRVHRILKDSCGNPRIGVVWVFLVSIVVLCAVVGCAFMQTKSTETKTKTEQGEKKYSLLHDAAEAGDLTEVKRFIAEGADVNVKDENGDTPLIIATNNDNNDIVKLLIENGANVNAEDEDNCTPLCYAIWNLNKDMVNLLISKGAEVNFSVQEGDSILYEAVWMANLDIVKILVDNGAKYDVKDEHGFTALHYAALQGSIDMVKLFISKGIDTSSIHMAACAGDLSRVKEFIDKGTAIDVNDEAGWTALVWAVCSGQTEVAEFFIYNNANINIKVGNQNQSLLHKAASVKLVEILIEKGIDVNVKSRVETTPIFNAASAGNLQKVELLVSKGADVNIKNRQGLTPLYVAVSRGHVDVVKFLLEKKADINAKNSRGQTPLDLAEQNSHTEIIDLLREHGAKNGSPNLANLVEAVASGDIEQVKLLISQGADINAKNNMGATVLNLACARKKLEVAEFLIDNSADVNNKNNRGMSLLHLASIDDQKDTVELLLKKGADINILNNEGRTPLDLAQQRGNTEIIELLKKYGAKESSSIENDGSTSNQSIHEAARNGDIELIKKLISEGADVNTKAENGQSVLHCAVENRHKDVAGFLIAQGADVNVLFNHGTPLFPAIFNDDLDIIQMLIDNGADCNINTPLIWAITALGEKDKEIVEILIRAGADINLKDNNGYTPLHWAVFSGSEEVLQVVLNTITEINTIHLAALKGDLAKVKAFVKEGIDVNSKDTSGCTSLHLAAVNNNNDVAEFLISQGADVNAKNNDGATPLLAARSLDMIKFLVSRGADVNAKPNIQGYTRLHDACQFDNDLDVASFLISKGANVNTANNWGVTALIGASTNGNREIVELLIDNGADVNKSYWNGSPIHAAAAEGYIDIVRLLILKGADINASDNQDRTPLFVANQYGHTEIVELLRKHGAEE